MNKFDSGPPPTEEQRRLLCQMMFRAFIEMRTLGWNGMTCPRYFSPVQELDSGVL
jgi:hypothetical protein